MSLNEFSTRMKMTGNSISEFEVRVIEFSQSDQKKEKK